MKNFRLTPEWVLNELPQAYNLNNEDIIMTTEFEIDFRFIKSALKTLNIPLYGNKVLIEDTPIYGILVRIVDVNQILKQKLKELETNNPLIRRGFMTYPETNDICGAFLYACMGLGNKIKNEINKSNQIDDILNSFSELVESKCIFSLDSGANICYCFNEKDERFINSNESGLYITLGIFACFRINLEYLELANPKLKGLNTTLSAVFPEIYNAYCVLAKKFDFTSTIKFVSDISITPEQLSNYIQNLEVTKWESDLLELGENDLEQEDSAA